MAKHYTYQDTQRPDGCYITFERLELMDDNLDRPDERQDGFWPSLDKHDPGYIGPNPVVGFAAQHIAAQDRMDAWEHGDWTYIGILARARVFIVRNGTGRHLTLNSAGSWGMASDSDKEYLDEVYQAEVQELKGVIAAMRNPIYEV